MSFTVLIPARLASTRLPQKALADVAGQPMIVRVAQRAALSGAARVIVATDSQDIVQVCQAARVTAVMTRADHSCGTDRLAQVVQDLNFADEEIVVNVQGDEPLISPDLIQACADTLRQNTQASMSTAAHAIDDVADLFSPHVVKVVLDAQNNALYFSRAPIAWWRDGWKDGAQTLPTPRPLRHVGIYGYRAGFLLSFPQLAPAPMEQLEALEQLRALWHGYRIAVHVTSQGVGAGVDTAQDLARVRGLFQSR